MVKVDAKLLDTFIRSYRVTRGKRFRLGDHDPGDTHDFKSEQKGEARTLLARGIEWLAEEQEKLYAQDRWGVLLVFQAMDAAGKDSTIKHVMSGVNPQGVHVTSFKSPSSEELDHDFMWSCMKALPERGRIGIFNRSYYEEVLVVRVHEEYLARQKLPPKLLTKGVWKERCEDIANFERYLARNGYLILKFYLHVSRDEQKKRFLERLDEPEKNWKFAPGDVKERSHWDDYMKATRTRSGARRRRTRLGTSSPRTASGSRGWSWPRRSSRGSSSSTSASRPSTPPSRRSSPNAGSGCLRKRADG
jgi:PPK2 family polyphosphate:nucleotide phosphotransferase